MKKYEIRITINGDYCYTTEHVPLNIQLNDYASGIAALGGTEEEIVLDGSILEINKKYYNRLKEDYKNVNFIKV